MQFALQRASDGVVPSVFRNSFSMLFLLYSFKRSMLFSSHSSFFIYFFSSVFLFCFAFAFLCACFFFALVELHSDSLFRVFWTLGLFFLCVCAFLPPLSFSQCAFPYLLTHRTPFFSIRNSNICISVFRFFRKTNVLACTLNDDCCCLSVFSRAFFTLTFFSLHYFCSLYFC